MRLIFYSAVNGTPICSVYAKEYLIYVYLCKPSPQIRAEASTCLSARSPIQRLFNSKRGDYPYFATYHILYSPRKTVERSKKGNQAPKQTVA